MVATNAYRRFAFPQLDSFVVTAPNVGTLQTIVIGYAHKRTAAGAISSFLGDAWKLAWVEVTNMESRVSTRFEANAWIDPRVPRIKLAAAKVRAALGCIPVSQAYSNRALCSFDCFMCK